MPTTIKVGQPAQVELPGEPLSLLRAAVLDFKPGRLVLMLEEAVPIAPSMMTHGATVQVGLVDRLGLHLALGTVVSLEQRRLTLQPQGEFNTQQRRQYFRLVFQHPVMLQVVQSWDPSLHGRSDPSRGDDLSGNGIRLRTRLPLLVGDSVSVQFALTDDRFSPPLRLEGVVKRHLAGPDLEHTVGVQFNKLSLREEDRLVSYLLKQQAKLGSH